MTEFEPPITEQSDPSVGSDPHGQRPLLRHTLFLTGSQVIGVPLSILTNAVTARYLGPAAFGYMYIGTTFNSFGFLAVDWGQFGALPALVATDRSRAGRFLGTSLIMRMAMAVPVYGLLIGLCYLLGYPKEVRVVVTLFFIGYALLSLANTVQSIIVGFERIEVAAYRQVLEQSASVLIVLPILVLGGTLNITLVGHAIVTALVLLYVWYQVRAMPVGRLSFDFSTLKTLVDRGTPFVFMNLAMLLQPSIDAAFLLKLTSADVVGWHSAARRLIGFLIFPASALIGALYPTLCRMHATSSEGFRQTTRNALRGTSLLVIPVALGCVLFADLGIAIFSRASFRPAENNLRVLSLFVLLLYFTMPLGVCVLAAGRQRAWAIVQSLCVVVSVVFDPILVPWFQRRTGNGGLGLCVAAVASELIVLVCGIWLAPRGIFDRRFWRSLVPALVSGLAMVLVALLLRSTPSLVAAPVSVAAYVGCLWATGGLDQSFILMLREFVESKMSRVRQTPPLSESDRLG